jgi:hypothetical protein
VAPQPRRADGRLAMSLLMVVADGILYEGTIHHCVA